MRRTIVSQMPNNHSPWRRFGKPPQCYIRARVLELSRARRLRGYSCLENRWPWVDCLISILLKWNLCTLISSERNIANVGWVCLSESAPVGPGPDIDIGDTFLHRLQS